MLTRKPSRGKTAWNIIKKISYWGIPGIILVSIFWTIDIHQLLLILQKANPGLLATGLIIYPGIVILGAYRWKILLTRYLNHEVRFWFVLRTYWIGLAIGKFFPGSVTWDIYRVMVTGRKFGNYTYQTIGVLLEKAAAVITAVLLIFSLYPFIPGHLQARAIPFSIQDFFSEMSGEKLISHYGPLSLVLSLIFVVAGYIAVRYISQLDTNWKNNLIRPLFRPGVFIPLLITSLCIYIGTAAANYYFFCALNTPVPFLIHLFLMPVFAVVLILPVTFAGLGLREGAFIILYGMFGVSMETALIASFVNLTANLLNSAVGGVIMLGTDSKA